MKFTLNEIAELLDGELEGNGQEEIFSISKIEEAKKGSISFLANPKYESYLYTTEATAVIVGKDFRPQRKYNSSLLRVADPYSGFTSLLEEYQKILLIGKSGIEQPSYIGEGCKIGENIYRGAFSYIGQNVRIGNNTKIYPQTFIGDNTNIGDNCIIYAGVKIYAGTQVGNNCIIHSGAVIGSDGFGFAPQSDGSYKTIPQLGNVIIEDNVSIGANTTIDCATLDNTIIRKGAKLDNLIQVAHNAEIGENTVIAAQAGISGSSKVGKNCVIAGQVGIVGHLQIADRTTIAAQSGISKSIDKKGTFKMGSPGFEMKDYMKSYAVFRNLPELWERVRQLEEKILNLPAK
ncbi:MAG: UDP-3-O-(3-hydroxymyristoyl)glucosamine N-acyltransferase [Cyclobacteriaceae bacterium]|nr:UDP-3-O-(3-hydroxymyristoyl)glucosamine N-acyltransferase [Cyclobacteriaceae bacterium]